MLLTVFCVPAWCRWYECDANSIFTSVIVSVKSDTHWDVPQHPHNKHHEDTSQKSEHVSNLGPNYVATAGGQGMSMLH